MRYHFGDAERAGDLLLRNQLRVLDRGPEFFGKELGVLERRVPAENDEFLATPADKGVCRANAAADELRKIDKDLVADAVSPRVVDLLEKIDVEHDERERTVPVV